ncbi:MAG TPA: amidohydrolase family protein [Gemmatimonadales bacterium]|nr:amidohydrolase family protein [Gemmatimonadales bacterium]
MRWIVALFAGTLLGCAAPQSSDSQVVETPTKIVRSARIFDGEQVVPGTTVLLRNDRILALVDESQESVTVPDGVEVLECKDCTLLPGLIDAHVHLVAERELQQALLFGVTTELDVYTFLPLDVRAELRRELQQGRADLADFRMATTPVTVPGGLGVLFNPEIPTLDDAADAAAFVDARIAEGADHLKIMFDDGRTRGRELPNLSPEMLSATVDAAHARGRLAVTHVTSRHGARAAIAAGSNGLAHIFADELADRELVAHAARQGVFVVATLTTVQGVYEGPSGADLADDNRFHPYLHPVTIANLRFRRSEAGMRLGSFENALENVRRFHEGGVRLLAGTDVSNPGTAHGISLHRELELLVRAGLTPVDALTAATRAPAEAFGLDDRGRIAPDLRADLLLVRGDPTRDIRATLEIVAVIRGGVQVDREALGATVRTRPE